MEADTLLLDYGKYVSVGSHEVSVSLFVAFLINFEQVTGEDAELLRSCLGLLLQPSWCLVADLLHREDSVPALGIAESMLQNWASKGQFQSPRIHYSGSTSE